MAILLHPTEGGTGSNETISCFIYLFALCSFHVVISVCLILAFSLVVSSARIQGAKSKSRINCTTTLESAPLQNPQSMFA